MSASWGSGIHGGAPLSTRPSVRPENMYFLATSVDRCSIRPLPVYHLTPHRISIGDQSPRSEPSSLRTNDRARSASRPSPHARCARRSGTIAPLAEPDEGCSENCLFARGLAVQRRTQPARRESSLAHLAIR